jgi:ABC-type multidrug transport system ATPase subunit
MQEAEVLCDRLGIFIDGRLACIGAPKAIAARFGGYYVRRCLLSGPCLCVH